jgi:hypothetical protein
LRRWVNAEKDQKDKSTNSQLNLTERDELLRLRKENAQLKMEREILKKAAAFFTQEKAYPIKILCKIMHFSRNDEQLKLLSTIQGIFTKSRKHMALGVWSKH